jgi:ABC-type multidrug transport system fused ATPase/permease subunit
LKLASLAQLIVSKAKVALNLRRAVRLVWESGPSWTLANTLLAVVQGLFPLLGFYLLKLLIDAVTAAATSGVRPTPEVFRHVGWLVGGLATLGLVQALLGSLETLVSEEQAQAVSDHMQNIVHSKAIEADLEYYENSDYYDTLPSCAAGSALSAQPHRAGPGATGAKRRAAGGRGRADAGAASGGSSRHGAGDDSRRLSAPEIHQ